MKRKSNTIGKPIIIIYTVICIIYMEVRSNISRGGGIDIRPLYDSSVSGICMYSL